MPSAYEWWIICVRFFLWVQWLQSLKPYTLTDYFVTIKIFARHSIFSLTFCTATRQKHAKRSSKIKDKWMGTWNMLYLYRIRAVPEGTDMLPGSWIQLKKVWRLQILETKVTGTGPMERNLRKVQGSSWIIEPAWGRGKKNILRSIF
jgi:hypothetical protein